MTAGAPSPARRGIVAVVAFVAAIHVGWWLAGGTAVGYGNLFDSDGYTWLVRVGQLLDGGRWFDSSMPRANAPDGGSLHWTRPFDALLIALAAPLMPALGVKSAVYWSAALVCPLLHLGVAAALAWAAAPVVGGAAAVVAGALTAAQFAVLSYAVVGRADHHLLQGLIAVVAFGFMVRALRRRDGGGGPALAAGATLAFGVWVGVEAQALAALCLAAMALAWVAAGDGALAANRRLALGFAGGMAAALLIERGPAGLAVVEYDRISIVHLAAATLALALWSAVAWWRRRGRGPGGATARLLVAVGGAALALAGLRLAFPHLLANPLADVDPRVPMIFTRTAEMEPVADVWHFLLYLGPAVLALPWGVRRLADEWRGDGRWPWLLLVATAAAYAALAMVWLRWSMYAELFMAVIVADLMMRADAAIERRLRGAPRIVAKVAALASIAIGPLAVGAAGVYATGDYAVPPAAAATLPAIAGDPRPCPLQPLARFLEAPPWGDKARTILASANFGAELLYRTRHRVTATVYHRNYAGIVDSARIFAAADDAEARKLVRKRGIELVLVCRHDRDGRPGDGDDGKSLYRRLEKGTPPPWLAEVALPDGLGARFRLFRVAGRR